MQLPITLQLTVLGGMVLTSQNPMPDAYVGVPYSYQIGVSGAKPPYTFSATSLPTGFSCSSAGLISGTPTTTGSLSFAITVTDSNG